MFNLGFTELLALAAIALVVIGPKQLPQVARVLGRVLGEFRRATGDFNREIYRAQEGFHSQMDKVEEHLDLSKAAETDRLAKNLDPSGTSLEEAEEKVTKEKKQEES